MATNHLSQNRAQTPAAQPKSDAPVDTKPEAGTTSEIKPEPAGLIEGEAALLRAVYGHMHHPFQVPLTFDTDRHTKVVVDRWVIVQFEAGKLAL